MIEVSVRDEHRIDRRQVAKPESGPAEPLENKNPAGKVGIDQQVLAADLEKEAGMTDEGDAQLATTGGHRLAGDAGAPGDGGMAHQGAELLSFMTDCYT